MRSETRDVVIFDVDGTLIRSTGVDDECLTAAFSTVFDVELPRLDWADFTHSTDQGLSIEVCQRWAGRTPLPEEVERVKGVFVELLRAELAVKPDRSTPVPGVHAMLDALAERPHMAVGVASGAWPESAEVKLAAAGVSIAGLPATFSHADALGRPATRPQIIRSTLDEIVRGAMDGDARRVGRVVYIGDGVWDARAARELGIGFVGLRHDRDESRLRALGAGVVLHDFSNLSVFLDALAHATPPRDHPRHASTC